ncbi:hypothetical protein [Planobacterium oryzisoli]|uniref:Uncharacterized protein n=1 Tax=Planobacterium oryzisoli TaxID=2771435 RepID=A0A931EB26_9FLAO|nr:hypothetical protein [Planobacterium oryzisoli]MBF5026814.1 hypothetical protein [Planobacterium oryzisoli]
MTDLDLLHFEQLKSEIQTKYLQTHTPSNENIAHWKGIDIIYFQEDLRKIAKGNISEKSFYTYFKTSPVTKLPRIDILNLLSQYAGYQSWFDFKKQHLFANEILENDLEDEQLESKLENDLRSAPVEEELIPVAQKSDPTPIKTETDLTHEPTRSTGVERKRIPSYSIPKYLILVAAATLTFLLGLFIFRDQLFSKEYYYNFIDSDRNSKINAELQVQILKENESPILYTAKPNEPFVYKNPTTKTLTMVVSSPYYRTDTIRRNLETAPESEIIELKPNDYAIMLYYYSNSLQDIKRKRETLNYLISSDALIYQVYDNETYGIETLDKQRYITLVTTPTTSLKNLEVIDTKMENGKIVLIKFRISQNEQTP